MSATETEIQRLTAEAAKSLAYAQARNGEIESLLDENEKLTAERDQSKDHNAQLSAMVKLLTAERDRLRAALVEICRMRSIHEPEGGWRVDLQNIARCALAEGTKE